MEGVIGMACGETSRFSEPYDSLMNLQRPDGWREPGAFRQARSMSVAENFNEIARYFLASPAQWLFLTNDDHVYPPDALVKLLARERDAVTGLYLSRQHPFAPVLGASQVGDGYVLPRYLEAGERGLARVVSCGDGCLLLRRAVVEAIPEPRWELGVYQRDLCDHDNAFAAKVVAAGFTIWCDLDVRIGHLAVLPVFPVLDDQGRWTTALVSGPRSVLTVPAARGAVTLV